MQTKGHWDTWCPIAGFCALHIFLTIGALQRCRIFQLDFVGAFLQSFTVNRRVTTLQKEWVVLFPDLAEWFGIPLLCRKSLYEGQYCNKSWNDHLLSWLPKYGCFASSPKEESSCFTKATSSYACSMQWMINSTFPTATTCATILKLLSKLTLTSTFLDKHTGTFKHKLLSTLTFPSH